MMHINSTLVRFDSSLEHIDYSLVHLVSSLEHIDSTLVHFVSTLEHFVSTVWTGKIPVVITPPDMCRICDA